MQSSPNRRPLFRPEALSAQSGQLHGAIRIATPPRMAAVAMVALALLLALVAFAVMGEATRKVKVAGVLLPQAGLLQISSPQPGRLQSISVAEGQTVAAGQLLAVLHLGGQGAGGDTAALLRQSLLARGTALQSEARNLQHQARQREQALSDRLRSLQRDITLAQAELDATEQRVRMAQQSLERDQGLHEQGFLSRAQLQSRQEELLDIQVRSRSAQRILEGLHREAQSVQAEMETTRIQARTQQAQMVRAQAALDQEATELDARNTLHLVAPGPGIVGALAVSAGQNLMAGQTVLSFVRLAEGAAAPLQGPTVQASPAGGAQQTAPSLHAQLYAPSRTAGFVAPGQPVWLRLHAFPFQKFGMLGGQVTEVSRTPVLPQDLPNGMANALMSAAQSHEPLYRITVALQRNSMQAFGEAQPLKAGMTLEADVIQDRRAIWEWVLEPLLAARARWQVPSSVLPNASPGGV